MWINTKILLDFALSRTGNGSYKFKLLWWASAVNETDEDVVYGFLTFIDCFQVFSMVF
jgi:hypothetical protein